jgi:hypothetical protein
VFRGEIHHRPWPLQAAEAEIELNTMGSQIGIELGDTPLLHFSSGRTSELGPYGG